MCCQMLNRISIFLLGVVSSSVAGGNVPSPEVKNSTLEMIFLTIDKTHNLASLSTLPGETESPKLLRTFKIATGKVDGDKERRGDSKTPEGIYFTYAALPSAQLEPKKYGPLALPLNFPNPMDKIIGKTGSGIWLHGVGDRKIEDARVTEGCVAFQNFEISSLSQWLRPRQGVVVIATDASLVNRLEDLDGARRTSQDWISAWAGRDVARYISFYAEDFDNLGKNRAAYETYKTAVFNSYKHMTVKISNLRVITHPKYALVMMNQEFNGDDRFKSNGRKMVYLRKDSGGSWKIVREMFDDFPMEPVQLTAQDFSGQDNDLLNGVSAPTVSSKSSGTQSR
jgi:murein L,D-transpeptidase YafK